MRIQVRRRPETFAQKRGAELKHGVKIHRGLVETETFSVVSHITGLNSGFTTMMFSWLRQISHLLLVVTAGEVAPGKPAYKNRLKKC